MNPNSALLWLPKIEAAEGWRTPRRGGREMQIHIEITANLIERAQQTGHPRLLAKLLRHEQPVPGTFQDVTIEEIKVSEATREEAKAS